MKKSALIFSILGVCCGMAHAQNSVTLYGILDEGIDFNSNAGGHRQYYMVGSVVSGNRFGFRGSEDLGGGLRAIFTLENGFDINTGALGQGGLLFGRQAFVGLASDRYGTVTLGRQYDSSIDYVSPLAANQWGGYIVASPADMENFTAGRHTNNSIKYASPQFAGLTFGGLYSLGGVAGDVTQNQLYSIGAAYSYGSWNLGAAYLNSRNPNASYYATSTAGATAATNNFPSPVNRGYASARTMQLADVAVSYTLGSATVSALYSNVQFKGLSGAVGVLNPAGLSGTGTFNNAALNFRYQLTPALLLATQYERLHGGSVRGARGATYNQFDFGADYFLSKRTDLYLIAVYQQASGTQSDGRPAVAAINVITPSSTNHQATVRLAMRHRF